MNGPLAALTIQQFLADQLASYGSPDRAEFIGLIALVLAGLVHATLLISLFAVLPMIYIWMERKVAGRIQDRLGPTRVGGKFGWLQTLADGIKLIQKEDLIPASADAMIFRMSPYLATIASFAANAGWSGTANSCDNTSVMPAALAMPPPRSPSPSRYSMATCRSTT